MVQLHSLLGLFNSIHGDKPTSTALACLPVVKYLREHNNSSMIEEPGKVLVVDVIG